MPRKSINTTLDEILYGQLQILALELSAKYKKKVYVNDLLEEGMALVLDKYSSKPAVSED